MIDFCRVFDLEPQPPVFLAEIGTFFNKDISSGIKIIEEISRVRDARQELPILLKGEVLHSADICRVDAAAAERFVDSTGKQYTEKFRSLIERKTVPFEEYAKLFARSTALGFDLVLSVYDSKGAVFAVEQKAVALKIASSNLRHPALHADVAALNVPMIIDEGRAPLSAVAATVERLKGAGVRHLLLEHSPDGHPAHPEAHNLRIAETYKQAFGLPVGLSDHYRGEEMLYAATALGYNLLEKGIALDCDAPDQGLSHAMPVERLGRVLAKIHDVYQACAGEPRRPLRREYKGNLGTSAHMGIVAARMVVPGEKVDRHTVGFAFPVGDGIGAEHWDLIEGWSFSNSLPAGALLHWKDLLPS